MKDESVQERPSQETFTLGKSPDFLIPCVTEETLHVKHSLISLIEQYHYAILSRFYQLYKAVERGLDDDKKPTFVDSFLECAQFRYGQYLNLLERLQTASVKDQGTSWLDLVPPWYNHFLFPLI